MEVAYFVDFGLAEDSGPKVLASLERHCMSLNYDN